MSSRFRAWAVAVVLAAAALPVSARGMHGGIGNRGKGNRQFGNGQAGDAEASKQKAGDGYIVIQARDPKGDVAFEAIPASGLKLRMEGLPDLYRDALKGWTAAKNEAEADGQRFAEPRPVRPLVQDYVGRVFPTLREATAAAEKCQERWDKLMAKKGEKPQADKGDAGPGPEHKAPQGTLEKGAAGPELKTPKDAAEKAPLE